MNKILLTALLAFLTLGTFAQRKKKLIEPAINEACDCLDGVESTDAEMEFEVQMCIVMAFTTEASAFMEYYELDLGDIQGYSIHTDS